MSTLHQLREGLHEAWDTLLDGWQRLYRRAAGAITRFGDGKKPAQYDSEEGREISTRSAGWGVLAAEVFDDDDKVVVRLEVPGMETDDLDLEVIDDYLVVSGEKRVEREHTDGHYHVTECAYGRFERAIPLPEAVNTDTADASYRNGVLRVELQKESVNRNRKITIKVD